jgi:hypothetical protein
MRLRALRARSSRGGLPAQETFPAKYRPSLSRLKGHRGFPAALRTGGHGFGAKRTRRRAPLALGFACLAALGLIFEVSVAKEVLFSRGEDEFRPTI